ncbi:DUF87 domain-containing protein (plasmid) [Methylomarinum sp. Ch1-1]|uniref:DUF87 domain-containing protein n=1 Tax=Methylomarinum roseum TaxID=3067653 RepID=A0AAU7P0H6_9GAMM|nr:DUF87 domain-containing protein [Methylomarinum sp. Ch1-1]MDP4518963.1 DUF87 domain-containing protein [Methylomarinum sp. Ch1-1]MDP4523361.1 DUF87 domain-containing protein [Methylomarinum sp. Ch1-1]
MELQLGIDDYAFRQKGVSEPIVWNSAEVVNGHILLVGKSGTGKTYTLRKLIHSGLKTGGGRVRFHIMDVHGDIEVAGASSVIFSEGTDYGLNPLKINPDRNFGGIRKRVQSFLSTLNRTQSRALGPKQEAVLRNIILDLYAANGFYPDKPESWHLDDGINRRYPKKFPNIEDAYRFSYAKLKQMYIGADTKTVKHLEDVNRKTSLLQRKLKKSHNSLDADADKLEQEIKNASEAAIESFGDYITHIQTGQELDSLIKYDSLDVLKSTVDRLENMKATGIFKNRLPPFENHNPIWRYDLCALSEEEKRMFVEFSLQELFAQAIQRGPVDDIHDVIILDEAHLFFKDDENNILNTLAKEARKFGVALVCASQSPTHFSDDFIANVATKIILGIDQMFWDSSARKMRIDVKMLNYIVPQKTIAAQINNKSSNKVAFKQIYVAE